MVDDISEKEYNPFIVNRGLSNFPDSIAFANLMNKYPLLDNKLQYSFYINILRKRKRFSKWLKPETCENLEVIKTYYDYSNEKALQVLKILTDEQISILKEKVSHGGKRK
jgi:hypothetical protein